MSCAESSKDFLLSTIANLHESGAYSDFKIVCGSDTYNVHKNIICPQSDFFRAACRPDTFQEGQTGVVTILANAGRDRDTLRKALTPDEYDWDQDVEDVEAVRAMIYYFYHHDYHADRVSDHARMYAMGEKYGIQALKALADKKFRQSFADGRGDRETAIVIAFTSTPDSDRVLRATIISGLGAPAMLGETLRMDETIKKIPDLVYPLYRRFLWRHYRSLETTLHVALGIDAEPDDSL
ncbi:hypothetical protein KCU71_g14009, partial [Aureobasidium melanogenum]